MKIAHIVLILQVITNFKMHKSGKTLSKTTKHSVKSA
ncbi:MAG: KxYKxGKxW signal peptide domain-containing protein [Bacteroidota bacterium]